MKMDTGRQDNCLSQLYAMIPADSSDCGVVRTGLCQIPPYAGGRHFPTRSYLGYLTLGIEVLYIPCIISSEPLSRVTEYVSSRLSRTLTQPVRDCECLKNVRETAS